MKKLLAALIVLATIAASAFADDRRKAGPGPDDSEGDSPVTVTAYSGVYYDAYPLTESPFAFLETVFNLRAGGKAALTLDLGESLSAGVEVGLEGMYVDVDGVTVYAVFDMPLRLLATFSPDGESEFSVFGGFLWTASIGDFLTSSLYYDAGLRVALESLFFEISYAVPYSGVGYNPLTADPISKGFLRFGVGYRVNIIR